MSRDVVKAEAKRLIDTYGDDAYAKATATVRLAMRRRNVKMSAFLAAVAGEVERRQRIHLVPGRVASKQGSEGP